MTQDEDRTRVACRLCGKEVPRSAARTAEGRDYAYYFCGEGCLQRWNADRRFDRAPGEPPDRR